MLTAGDKRSLRRAAALGARSLDKISRGWWRRVKISELNMSSACNCVVGQVSNAKTGWARGTQPDGVLLQRMCGAAGLPVESVAAVGYMPSPEYTWDTAEAYDELHDAWVAEIAARRRAARVRVAARA